MSDMFHYKDYDIPVKLVNMTGGGPDTFDEIVRAHISNYVNFIGLNPKMNICEIGCGIGRDAMQLADILDKDATYCGIDIIGESIKWCTENISVRHTNFKFYHFDVKDQLHNPLGKGRTSSIKIPIESGTTDFIIVQSVFTHMFKKDILHYLKEFRRILKIYGKVYATFFIVNDNILKSARATNSTKFNLHFKHNVGGGCYVNDLLHPLGAVAYTEKAALNIIQDSELTIMRRLFGTWSGYYASPEDGQDAFILTSL